MPRHNIRNVRLSDKHEDIIFAAAMLLGYKSKVARRQERILARFARTLLGDMILGHNAGDKP